MSSWEVQRLDVSASSPPGTTWDVSRLSLTGTLLIPDPSWVVSRLAVTGSGRVALNAIAAQTVEPMGWVYIAAIPSAGSTVDTYIWRVISGAVSLTQTGATQSFIAPATLDGVTVQIGVKATRGAETSAEVIATVTVYPQIDWIAAGGTWKPYALQTLR